MNCNEIRELISSMLDRELNAEDSAVVSEHLAECPECMRVFEAFHAISVSLEELEDVPEGFTEAVMQKINTPAPVKKRRPGYIRIAGLAACLALVLFTGNQFVTSHLHSDDRHIQDTAEYTRVTHQTPRPTPTPTPLVTAELVSIVGEDTSPIPDTETSMTPDGSASKTPVDEVDSGPVVTPTPEALPIVSETPIPAETPRPTATPQPIPVAAPEALTTLNDLLFVTEEADFNLFTEQPDYELIVRDEKGNEVTLLIWLDNDRIYCKNLVEGYAWYAVGTAEDLRTLTQTPEEPPVSSPVPSPVVSEES